MKTNAIVRIIIWSLVVIILVSVFTGFIADEIYLSRYEPGITATEPVLEEVPVQPLPNEETLTLPADSIREIEIEWVAGNILLQPADVDAITISESDVSDAKYAMVWKQKNDKLSILFCEESLVSGLSMNFNADLTKDLYIYVPRDWVCRSLEIDAASATVEVYNMTIHEMDFDGASGTCDLQNCQIRDLDIDTASGDVNYSGTLDTLDFDAASASFIAQLTNTPSRIDMDGMSGALDITLPEDTGFTLSMDGMSSRFSSEFDTTTRNGAHVHGNGHCRINVDGMSCDVTIRKATLAPVEETVYPIDETIDPTMETVPPCTDPECTDPGCVEHGHAQENCTDESCPVHSHEQDEGHHE